MKEAQFTARTTLHLDGAMYEHFRQEAYQQHTSISAVVRQHLNVNTPTLISARPAPHVPNGNTPEKRVENHIKADLQANGWFSVKYFANALTSRGVPDILACVNGTFVAIEVKAPQHGAPTLLQLTNLQHIADAGGVAILSNDKNVVTTTLVAYLNHQALPAHCVCRTYHQGDAASAYWDGNGIHTVIFTPAGRQR